MTPTTKHTPGPWTAQPTLDGHSIEHNDGISTLTLAYVHGRNEGSEANARLIAAAPELRAVLAALFEHCAMVHKHWGDGNNVKQADAAIEQGRALLDRIDGQSPDEKAAAIVARNPAMLRDALAETEALYGVADDDEADVLDALRERAGITWTCRGPHPEGKPSAWTNDGTKACDICGREKEARL